MRFPWWIDRLVRLDVVLVRLPLPLVSRMKGSSLATPLVASLEIFFGIDPADDRLRAPPPESQSVLLASSAKIRCGL